MKSVSCRTNSKLCTSTREAIALFKKQECAIDAVRMQAIEFSECTVNAAIAMSKNTPRLHQSTPTSKYKDKPV